MFRKRLGLSRGICFSFVLLLSHLAVGQSTRGDELSDLMSKANSGDPAAMFKLGMDYQSGKLVGQDLAASRSWVQKAAEAGNTDAMDRMGNIDRFGYCGATRDTAAAIKWYQIEARAGTPLGCLTLQSAIGMGSGCQRISSRQINCTRRRLR